MSYTPNTSYLFNPYAAIENSHISSAANCYNNNQISACLPAFTPNSNIAQMSSNVFHGQDGPNVRSIVHAGQSDRDHMGTMYAVGEGFNTREGFAPAKCLGSGETAPGDLDTYIDGLHKSTVPTAADNATHCKKNNVKKGSKIDWVGLKSCFKNHNLDLPASCSVDMGGGSPTAPAIPTPSPTYRPSGPVYTPSPTYRPSGPVYTPSPTDRPSGPVYTPSPVPGGPDQHFLTGVPTPGGPVYTPSPVPGGPVYTPSPAPRPGAQLAQQVAQLGRQVAQNTQAIQKLSGGGSGGAVDMAAPLSEMVAYDSETSTKLKDAFKTCMAADANCSPSDPEGIVCNALRTTCCLAPHPVIGPDAAVGGVTCNGDQECKASFCKGL